MAHYTITLREVLDLTGNDIGLDQYPLFDESHREELNQKITDHYYFREIGFETIDIFTQRVKSKMNLIMPYYNQLYKSEALKIDPLRTMEIWATAEGTSGTVASNESESDNRTKSEGGSKSRSVTSEMPASMLAGNKDYATSGVDASSKNESSGSNVSSGTSKSSQDSKNENSSHQWGTSGSQADLLLRYRGTFINIDHAIVRELEPLFLGILSVSDSYTYNSIYTGRFTGGYFGTY